MRRKYLSIKIIFLEDPMNVCHTIPQIAAKLRTAREALHNTSVPAEFAEGFLSSLILKRLCLLSSREITELVEANYVR